MRIRSLIKSLELLFKGLIFQKLVLMQFKDDHYNPKVKTVVRMHPKRNTYYFLLLISN